MARSTKPGIPPAGAGDRPKLSASELRQAAAPNGSAAAGVPGSVTERKINLLRKRRYDAVHRAGGARIQEGVVSLAGYAEIFYRNVESSGVIPQISLIVGPCTGGAVYSPAMTDFICMVRKVGYMFITGPDVIKVTTGEQVTFEELGGADVHNQRSGVAHFMADTEDESFAQIRELLSFLPANNKQKTPHRPTLDDS